MDGLYWHGYEFKGSNFHLDKTNKLKTYGIRLIHIFEDEYNHKKDIVKSRIMNILGKTPNILYARKTKIIMIDNKTSSLFMEENHIQGNVVSKYRYGLYYNDVLVSVMTFGKNRINVSKKSNDGEYELLRFCNKKDTIIIGGASRLLRMFIKDINPIRIKSFSDRSIHNGKVYENIGFTKIDESDPNYHWIVHGLRKNRFLYRKDILVRKGHDKNMTENEIMKSLGYYRVFDCGSSIYEMVI
jgi:ribosomal protein S24E